MQWILRKIVALAASTLNTKHFGLAGLRLAGLTFVCPLVIVGQLVFGASLILQAADTHAQGAAARRAVKLERTSEELSVDNVFVQARAAMTNDNLAKFDSLAARAGEHSLNIYLRYWSLKLRLAERFGQDDATLDELVRKFLAEQNNTVVADLLRRDWMLNLGRRNDWATLESQYAQWVLRDDSQAHCYQLVARANRGEPVAAAARVLLSQTRDFGDACTLLLDTLARNGLFKRDDLIKQLAAALELNAPSNVRRIAMQLNLDADRLDLALSKPARVIGSAGNAPLEMIALSRLARQDVAAAAERVATLPLTGIERQFALAQVAAASMRKLDPDALRWSRETVALGVNNLIGDETWVWLARAALRAQDWKLLASVIARMSPESQREATWVYWQGRVQAASGKRPEAEALWKTIASQYHFYGQLAAEELGQLTVIPSRAEPVRDTEMADIDRNPGFARALQFYALGLRVEGNREWNYQLRGMNDRQLLAAAQWACQRKILDRCVNTADRTTSEHDFSLRFIAPFHEELKPFAKDMGLDSTWVYGLIRQESRFIMDARSSVGASGLMQIMPSTGRWIARKLGVTDFSVDQLTELPTNLRFGTFYLKSVQDDLDGSALLASAAYNAGPNRSRSWRAGLSSTVEGAIFAELIPFAETRDYVKKVLSNSTYYSALFTGQPQSLKQRLGTVSPKAAGQTELP